MAKEAQRVRQPPRRARTFPSGVVHVNAASFNNTMITVHRRPGQHDLLVVRRHDGLSRVSRKSTPYAAQVLPKMAARKASEHGVRTVEEVEVTGPGSVPRVSAAACAPGRGFT